VSQIRGVFLVVGLLGLAVVFALSWAGKRIKAAASEIRPLESHVFDQLTAVTLGSGTGAPNQRRYGPATAVGFRREVTLIDAGRGAADALRAAGIPARQPTILLLTSLLPESTVGFDDLLAARASDPEAEALRVFGPPGVENFVLGVVASNRAGLAGQKVIQELKLIPNVPVGELEGSGGTLGGSDVEIHWAALGSDPIQSIGYRFSRGETCVVVSARVFEEEALLELGADCDLWVQSATYRTSVESAIEAGASEPDRLRTIASYALAVEDLGSLASRMGIGHLILTQLSPPPVFGFQYTRIVARDFEGAASVASDGDRYTP
jgi:ribonuclease BN (tRNA processing enzyme)